MNEKYQLLVFTLDERRYALHLRQVERVVRAVDTTPLPQAPDIVIGAIDVQGAIIPVLNIRQRFGAPARPVRVEDHFIIALTARRRVALLVDSVQGVVERADTEIFDAGKIVGALDQVEGVVRLEDGLLIIHNLDHFLSLDEEQTLERSLQE